MNSNVKGRLVSRLGDRSFPSRSPSVTGSSNVVANNKPVLRVGDRGLNGWYAIEGAPCVLVNGRRVHRLLDSHSASQSYQGGNVIIGDHNQNILAKSYPDTVKEVKIHFKAFIPNTLHKHWSDKCIESPGRGAEEDENCAWFDGPVTDTLNDVYYGGTTQYRGDNRGFFEDLDNKKFRIYSCAVVRISGGKIENIQTKHEIGETHQRVVNKSGAIKGGPWVKAALDKGSKEIVPSDYKNSLSTSITFTGNAQNPFFYLAPEINYNVNFELLVFGNKLELRLTGWHNRFPGFEAYAEYPSGIIHRIWWYDPENHSKNEPGLLNLTGTSSIEENAGYGRKCEEVPVDGFFITSETKCYVRLDAISLE